MTSSSTCQLIRSSARDEARGVLAVVLDSLPAQFDKSGAVVALLWCVGTLRLRPLGSGSGWMRPVHSTTHRIGFFWCSRRRSRFTLGWATHGRRPSVVQALIVGAASGGLEALRGAMPLGPDERSRLIRALSRDCPDPVVGCMHARN